LEFPISLPSAAPGEVGKSATSVGLKGVGCNFGATEGDRTASSRGWCLLEIPRSLCSAGD